jgi:hypothetical protein
MNSSLTNESFHATASKDHLFCLVKPTAMQGMACRGDNVTQENREHSQSSGTHAYSGRQDSLVFNSSDAL